MNGLHCIHFIAGACSLFSTLISISYHCSDILRDQKIFVKMTADVFSRMWNHYIFGGFMITMALIMFIYVFICIYICIYLSWKKQSNEVVQTRLARVLRQNGTNHIETERISTEHNNRIVDETFV